ncbi:hypothetical protein ACIPC1_02465 [Streptomyces sp. NPDC087263]|uniref:hypothetical protein n=1 Tax=Streptomyces sp. NPDC087263 TaxID=3365773 RepID=UPI0038150604
MRKLALSLGLAAVCGTALIAVAPVATASETGAQAACFTLWDTAGYKDGSRVFSGNDSDFSNNNWSSGKSSNNSANSGKNACSHNVYMYAETSYAGQSYYLQDNSVDSDFGNNGFSNTAESLNGF